MHSYVSADAEAESEAEWKTAGWRERREAERGAGGLNGARGVGAGRMREVVSSDN